MELVSLPIQDAMETMAIGLDAIAGETQFFPEGRSPTLGFNQQYLGPVLRLRSGTTVQAEVRNSTARPISVHWHGLLIPGDVDGGPHQPIEPGTVWRPMLPINQPRAMLWYHTHIHGETAEGVYAGLAGILLVDDGEDRSRGLPVNLGVDDLLLVVQDKRFVSGRAVYDPTAGDLLHGFLGDTVLVNGTVNPVAAVPAGIVRLRVLNAANARNFDFFFNDQRPFHLVASDQGILPAPIVINRLRLSPGERVELLVDFAGTSDVSLMSHPHDEGSGANGMGHDMSGMVANEERLSEPFEVMAFRTSTDLPAAVSTMPQAFAQQVEPVASEPTTTREFVLNDSGDLAMSMPAGNILDNLTNAPPVDHGAHGMAGMGATAQQAAEPVFGINGQSFDMARIDFLVEGPTIERWIIRGEMMGHPFHIHGARFQVVRDNGGSPRPENRGWKDTVFVDGEVELLVQFREAASASSPFMFHCHVLEHEDRGMMGQFTVTRSAL